MILFRSSLGALLACALLVMPAAAGIEDKLGLDDIVEIHGFGGWSFADTDGNVYRTGNEDGAWDNIDFGLNLSASPIDRLTINLQGSFEREQEDDDVMLDYAFAEWAFRDEFKIRAGKVKSPFGIYTEIFDIGTLRPFLTLPSAIYAAPGLVNKSYLGAGLAGSFFFENGWGASYDVYGGESELQDFQQQGFDFATLQGTDDHVEITAEKMVAAKLSVFPPVAGLNVGLSFLSGEPVFDINGEAEAEYYISGRQNMYAVHAEYAMDPWLVRAEYEYVESTDSSDFSLSAGYLELAYKLTEQWQLAFLYDAEDVEINVPGAGLLASLQEHEEFAFGLNYWISPQWVCKVSYHFVDGNYFAQPEDLPAAVQAGGIDENTEMFMLGTQFSF